MNYVKVSFTKITHHKRFCKLIKNWLGHQGHGGIIQNQANIYLFKVVIETLEKGVKYIQS